NDIIRDTGDFTADTLMVTVTEDDNVLSIARFGTTDDLVIAFDNGTSVTIEDQFVSDSAVEKLTFRFIDPVWGNETDTFTWTGTATNGQDLLVSTNQGISVKNALGGDDIVAGGSANDTLTGGAGYDEIFGNAGADVLYGDVFNNGAITPVNGVDYDDDLYGGFGNDKLYGQVGNDWLNGFAGSDLLNGGNSWDTADYFNSPSGITVTLTNGSGTASDGFGSTDTLVNIESVHGSAFDDRLTFGAGNTSNLNFTGGRGNDIITGSTNNCGEIVKYDDDPARVLVNLRTSAYSGNGVTIAASTGKDGWGTTDRLTQIDGVSGSQFNDVLVGGNGAFLRGGKGNDIIVGTGNATVGFWEGTQGARVNIGSTDYVIGGATLVAGKGIDEFGTTDTLSGIGNISGSYDNDILIGSATSNSIQGNSGNDTIDGGAGVDDLRGDGGNDVFRFRYANQGGDTIADFTHGVDKIQLVSANFGFAVAALPTNKLLDSGDPIPSSACLIYNQSNGTLSYHSAAGATSVLAHLTGNPTLTTSDFVIVAN
ncbi:MAG TPA: calcium-binding protein, partial [Magnetospirillum sp.]|nr:calcium-binding protein [Magnetospirillum sp.]